MSVVVIRDGILYTDSLGLIAPCCYKKKIEKQIADPNGDLVYAFCGDLPRKKDLPNLMTQARAWFQNWYFGAEQEGVPDPEAIKKFLPDSWFIVAWNDGYISYKYGRITIHEIDDPIDGGDGGTYTMAMLDVGLRGEALELAVNDCNVNSGLGMRETDLTSLKDPVNEKEIVVGSVEPIHVEAQTVDSELSVVVFNKGLVSFSNRMPLPWRNTERADFNFDDCYTKFGFFIPWGMCSRLFHEFTKTGYSDPQAVGQGSSCGMLISSDGLIYDVSFFGVAIAGFAESQTKPGQWDVRPIGMWHEDFMAVKGSGWNREYVYACVRAGKSGEEAITMAHERFSCPAPHSYHHLEVSKILEELKVNKVKPVSKASIRGAVDFKVFAKHYKEIERLFPQAMIEKYKL